MRGWVGCVIMLAGWAVVGEPAVLSAAPSKPLAAEAPAPSEPAPVLGVPRGTPVTISGRFVERDARGQAVRGLFRVMRLEGTTTQADLLIHIKRRPTEDEPEAQPREHFAFRGIEVGGWFTPDGQPCVATAKKAAYRAYFVVSKESPIAPLQYSPAQFLGRSAWLQGEAVNLPEGAALRSGAWTLLLDGAPLWPDAVVGKLAESVGLIEAGSAAWFRQRDAQPRLSGLPEQLGMAVTLRGHLRTGQGHWWLDFRGQTVFIEKPAALPGWKADLAHQEIVITGVLAQRKLPRVDMLLSGAAPALAEYFVLTKPAWQRILPADRAVAAPYAADYSVLYPDGYP